MSLIGERLTAYEKAREKVIYSDDCDVFAAREVAYAWHSGQDSALYSFASTDATVWSEEHRGNLIHEVERAIHLTKADPDKYYPDWESVDQYTRESRQSGTPEEDWGSPADAGLESLDNLLRVVRAMPAKNPNDGEEA